MKYTILDLIIKGTSRGTFRKMLLKDSFYKKKTLVKPKQQKDSFSKGLLFERNPFIIGGTGKCIPFQKERRKAPF